MPCEQWFETEKHYRVAVHAYADAVDRLDRTRGFERAWQKVESCRTQAEEARTALRQHQDEHQCVPTRAPKTQTPSRAPSAPQGARILTG